MKREIETIKKALNVKSDTELARMMSISLTVLGNMKSGNGSNTSTFCLRLAAASLAYVSKEDRKKLRQTLFEQWSEQMKKSLGL